MYDVDDTLFNGIPGISGNYTWGVYPTAIDKEFGSPPDINTYSVWVKFTYINLGTGNAHEGWLIDNLQFAVQVWSEEIDVFEINKNTSIKLYPNPVNNFLHIDNPFGKTFSIQIIDIYGKEIYYINKSAAIIDVSFLTSGLYIIKTNQNYLTKFIKL